MQVYIGQLLARNLHHYIYNIIMTTLIFLDYTIQQMWTAKIISFFTPDECLGCGKQPKIICDICLPNYVQISPISCTLCNKVTNNTSLCYPCSRKTGLKNVWSATTYNENAKRAVHKLKFAPNRAMGLVLADCLDVVVPHWSSFIVVHVPTAPKRVRQRGFDHANVMARRFAKQRNLGYYSALIRTSNQRQVGASRKERKLQLKDRFIVIDPRNIKNKHVLVVDDVMTTAATLSEVAKTLKKAGAKYVSAAVFAVAPLN